MRVFRKIFGWIDRKVTYSLVKQTTDPVIWNVAIKCHKRGKDCSLIKDWKNNILRRLAKDGKL